MSTGSAPGALSIDSLPVVVLMFWITASKCISKLARLRRRNTLHHGLQVHCQNRTIMASKLAWLRPPSVSLNWIHYGLQFNLHTHLFTASKRISELTESCPPSASSYSLDHSLQVHLQCLSITACKCISKNARFWHPPFAQSQTPSASPTSLDHGLGQYLWVHMIVIFRHIPNCSQELHAAGPDIPCVDRWLYRYINP